MGAKATQITTLTIVYSTVYSGTDQGTGEFHTQRVSNAENVSIWWRHHDSNMCQITHSANKDEVIAISLHN